MNELEDIKLRVLLQNLKLDSPEPDFTLRVMNRVIEENLALEQIKSQPILGKGFWIFILIFVILMAIIFFVFQGGAQGASGSEDILSKLDTGVSQGIQSFFGKLGTVPLSVAGILIATSLLLFIDRFITSNTKLFA